MDLIRRRRGANPGGRFFFSVELSVFVGWAVVEEIDDWSWCRVFGFS